MGNGAVSHDGSPVAELLDQEVPRAIQKKPSSSKEAPLRSAEVDDTPVSTPHVSDSASVARSTVVKEKEPTTPKPRSDSYDKQATISVTDSKSKSGLRARKKVQEEDIEAENVSDVSSGDDMEPVDVLLQFIPFYGQGDPANDSIVRSALSSLSVEDIDAKDEYGNTLLLLACQYRCEDLVRIMLNKGADPNAVNSAGASCLHFACYADSSSLAIVKILLQNGANPDVAESNYGCMPLHYCASSGDLEFCKLMLQYGAQINAYDYYNYTCVDYARESGFHECADFLQKRLDKVVGRQAGFLGVAASTKAGGGGGGGGGSTVPRTTSFRTESGFDDFSYWESHVDPGSGAKYYIHTKTGECLWESELKARIQQQQQAQQLTSLGMHSSSGNNLRTLAAAPAATQQAPTATPEKAKISEAQLISQATEARLIAFLTKHDPSRLPEVSELMDKHKGREAELLNDLCKQYNVQEDPEFRAFQEKLAELRSVVKAAHDKVTDISLVDPLVVQDIAQETRKNLEVQFAEEKNQLRQHYETQREEDKTAYRAIIIEKEGQLAKLTAEMEALTRSKANTEADLVAIHKRLEAVQSSDCSAQSTLQAEVMQLNEEASRLKAQIQQLDQDLYMAKDQITSLEQTLHKVTAGKEEMLAQEQAAAAERLEHQRQREAQYTAEMAALETRYKNAEMKLRSDLNQMKNDNIRVERSLKEELEQLKRAKDREIEALRKELADRRAQFAQEISAKQMEMEDMKKALEEASKRAAIAEEYQRLVANEIAEAKIVQKYNAQLHKDLQREQQARKKLHNDMEDLKGKIRVYVRIRPYSNTERERGCQEAVIRDGKMTVLVKGIGAPDAKKVYDFDQVFGGSASEGNSQVDVFKDTKHLVMSVVDGYNVCIFAYGQTGAGKSYTMIGAADIGSCLSDNGDFDEHAGVTPRAVSELFRLLHERTAQLEYSVEVTMFQLYRDNIEDLLKERKRPKKGEEEVKEVPLKIVLAEHSPTGLVHVEGAESLEAASPADVMRIFAKGSARRTTASTQMNAESSRSHLICSLVVKLTNRRSGAKTVGKLTLVDLAGSERVDKSGASGEQLKEAQSINKSLSALGDVIAALTSSQQHVPYRNHPLTMLMSDSIGGNAKTLMFVNTSPADYNVSESNNSLQFASRCKDITNAVSAAPGVQAAQISALKKELAKLKKTPGGPGAGAGGKGGGPVPAGTTLARPDTAAQGGDGGRRRGSVV